MPSARYAFYEEVIVDSAAPHLVPVAGLIGVVVGAGEGADGNWAYAVLFETSGECWSIDEPDLRGTGRQRRREEFYGRASLRVDAAGKLRGETPGRAT
jgi:hypothetical protein